MSQRRLKPCPKCGSQLFIMWDDSVKWQVECQGCRSTGPKRVKEEAARKAWGYEDVGKWYDRMEEERERAKGRKSHE